MKGERNDEDEGVSKHVLPGIDHKLNLQEKKFMGIHVRKHLFFRFLIKVKSVCVICKFNK
ncbi:MAG: hypothetical protein IJ914_10225 [Prevotella sp.]|nr:hypothetical protein [Prevotella sp.]